MNRLFLFVALFAIGSLFSAPLLAEAQVKEDIVYVQHDDLSVTYDVLMPENANGAGVVMMSSGGWFSRKWPVAGIKDGFGYLLDAGYTLIPVRHRSAPVFKVPQAVDDVQLALRHIRSHADEYGVYPNRLATFGFSSGGHLTLMVALDSDDGDADSEDSISSSANHVAAAVAFFPPVDLNGLTGPSDRYPALDFDAEQADSVSPIKFVDESDPPVLLIHGTADAVVPLDHSERMKAALDDVGVSNKLRIFEGGGHGNFTPEQNETARDDILAFLGEYLAAK